MSAARHNAPRAPSQRTPDALPKLLTPAQRHATLHASAWFAGLPADLQAWLAEHARPVAFAAGQRLFGRGDPADGIYFVVDGSLRISTSTSDGREALLAFAEAPQWFGETALFDGAPRTHDAWGQGDGTLLHVGQQRLLELLERRPEHWRQFGLLITQKLRLAFHAIEGNSLLSPATRLARRLVAIVYGYGDWSGPSRRVIDVQQDQLGAMVSLSRQTVNKILGDFETQGYLRRNRGAIEILDLDGFKRFAAED
jgi:CRP/FNR family cyclic AMP-dependent transcriptional regulator